MLRAGHCTVWALFVLQGSDNYFIVHDDNGSAFQRLSVMRHAHLYQASFKSMSSFAIIRLSYSSISILLLQYSSCSKPEPDSSARIPVGMRRVGMYGFLYSKTILLVPSEVEPTGSV